MVNESSFVSSHCVSCHPALGLIDHESSRRDHSSSDSGYTGNWAERRLLVTTSIDHRTHHETKWSRFYAVMGNGVDRSDRRQLVSRTDPTGGGNRLHSIRTTRIDPWCGLHSQDQIPVRRNTCLL